MTIAGFAAAALAGCTAIAQMTPRSRRTVAAPGPRYARSKYHVWAALLERTFALDILSCSDCGGRLRFIATINDSSVIDKILSHLGLPTEAPRPAPAKVAGWLPGFEPAADWITE